VQTYTQHFDYISDFLWLHDKRQLVATRLAYSYINHRNDSELKPVGLLELTVEMVPCLSWTSGRKKQFRSHSPKIRKTNFSQLLLSKGSSYFFPLDSGGIVTCGRSSESGRNFGV